MWPSTSRASLASVAWLAFLVLPTTISAIDPRAAHHGMTHAHSPSDEALRRGKSTAYPYLTWIRDSILNRILGKPKSSAGAAYSPIDLQRYAGETVIRLNFSTAEEDAALAAATDQLLLDVWDSTDSYLDVRVRKHYVDVFLSLLPESLHRSFSTLVPDLAEAVKATYPSRSPTQPKGRLDRLFDEASTFNSFRPDAINHTTLLMDDIGNVFFQDYQPLPVLGRWMRLLEALFPDTVRMIHVGETAEGRNITGLRVGAPTKRTKHHPRKTILVTGGMHAREWISTSTVAYLAWSFISANGKDPTITKFLLHFDMVFVPVMNPDGYEYTWSTDRLWRKNRQDIQSSICRGLDLDHAFGYEWETRNSEPCSEMYGGEEPFQALEARTLSEWARKEQRWHTKFVGLVDLHSYSQQLLFPYAYSCEAVPPNLENLEELAADMAKAIRLHSGEQYQVTSACEGVTSKPLEPTVLRMEAGGGSAIDWFFHELGAKWSYRIKLRDTGSYGFLLPSPEIVPTGEEILHAMRSYADYILGNNGIERAMPSTSTGSGLEKVVADDRDTELR